MLDAVFDAVSARLEHRQLAGRIVGVQVVHFGRHRRTEVHVDHGVIATSPNGQVVLRVVLLEDQDVTVGSGAEFVAPELVRSLGLVDARVEEVAAVHGPREAVVDVVELVVDAVLSSEWADRHVVEFVAVKVRAHADPVVVGTHGEYADREVVTVSGLGVLVEDHLFAGEGRQRIDLRRRADAGRRRSLDSGMPKRS